MAEAAAARLLILAPIGRDALAIADLLQRNGLSATPCPDLAALVQKMDNDDIAAVIIAEEGLFGRNSDALSDWVSRQPAWSDLPFIILTSRQEQQAVVAWRRSTIAALRNVSLLERPVQAITLTSAVQAAIRARRRQYEVRALLQAREQAAETLERLVVERTLELERANAELRRQMEERSMVESTLRQAQKMEAIGQLTGGVAHDFNNLLMVISGGLETLERRDDPERRRRLIEGMRQAAQRGAGLTRQLLAFSRRQGLTPEPVDLARQIGRMRELLDRSLRGDVHVAIEFPDDLWPVHVDPSELELVVLNLAVNARDAMPAGGTITLRAENVAAGADELDVDHVSLVIVDTGTGMPPDVRERAFEPFFTTKDIGKGSGLGLPQVYGFAKQSGGKVRIESALGVGTSVFLLLPRSAEMPSPERKGLIDIHTERNAPGAAGAVLMVEDDDEVATLVGEMLDQLGYAVTRASSAAAALGALANGRRIDVVFSDIMMPGGMNGVDLAREVRARRPGTPVILTSGYAEAARKSAEAEGVPVLPKPYGIDDLAAVMRKALASPAHQPSA
jgi:signal transduction histidine kinase/ActR/RegA family two-component response regulator